MAELCLQVVQSGSGGAWLSDYHNVQLHIQAKWKHFSQEFPIHVHVDCTFFRGISNIILSLQQNDTHVVEVQQDMNLFKS